MVIRLLIRFILVRAGNFCFAGIDGMEFLCGSGFGRGSRVSDNERRLISVLASVWDMICLKSRGCRRLKRGSSRKRSYELVADLKVEIESSCILKKKLLATGQVNTDQPPRVYGLVYNAIRKYCDTMRGPCCMMRFSDFSCSQYLAGLHSTGKCADARCVGGGDAASNRRSRDGPGGGLPCLPLCFFFLRFLASPFPAFVLFVRLRPRFPLL